MTLGCSLEVLAQATPRGRGSDNGPARQTDSQTRGGDRAPGRTSEPPVPQPRDRGSVPEVPQRSSGGESRPSENSGRGGDRSPSRPVESQSGPSRPSGGDNRPVRDSGSNNQPTPIVRGERSPERTSGPSTPSQRDNGSRTDSDSRNGRTGTVEPRDGRAPVTGPVSTGTRDSARTGGDRNQPPQSFGTQPSRDLDRVGLPFPQVKSIETNVEGRPGSPLRIVPGHPELPTDG